MRRPKVDVIGFACAGCGGEITAACARCAPAAPATAFLLEQLRQEATRIARLLTLELRERALPPGIGLAQVYAVELAMRLGASAEEISAPEGT